MNLTKADLLGRIHKDSLVETIQASDENVGLLLSWSLSTAQPLGWRSTWILKQIIRKNDPRIGPYLSQAIDRFSHFNKSQQREWLKILAHQKLTEEQEGLLFDSCIAEWKNLGNQPSLRSSAIEIVFSILKKYPELHHEMVHIMTKEYVETLSAGIRKGVVKKWESIQGKH